MLQTPFAWAARLTVIAAILHSHTAFAFDNQEPIEVETFEVKTLDITVDSVTAEATGNTGNSRNPANPYAGVTPPTTPLVLSFKPKQYSAVYESEYQGKSVKGTRSLMFKDGLWVLKTKLKKLVVSVVEEAEVSIAPNGELKPQAYEYKRSVLGIKKRQRLRYDYSKQQIHFKDGDDEGSYPLLPHSFDKASQQFLIEDQLRRGVNYFTTNQASRNRNKVAEYRVLGEDFVELPIGVTKAIKVEIVPDPRKKRHTIMWFDPQRNYLLVKLNQTDKNGKTYSMNLADVKFLD